MVKRALRETTDPRTEHQRHMAEVRRIQRRSQYERLLKKIRENRGMDPRERIPLDDEQLNHMVELFNGLRAEMIELGEIHIDEKTTNSAIRLEAKIQTLEIVRQDLLGYLYENKKGVLNRSDIELIIHQIHEEIS